MSSKIRELYPAMTAPHWKLLLMRENEKYGNMLRDWLEDGAPYTTAYFYIVDGSKQVALDPRSPSKSSVDGGGGDGDDPTAPSPTKRSGARASLKGVVRSQMALRMLSKDASMAVKPYMTINTLPQDIAKLDGRGEIAYFVKTVDKVDITGQVVNMAMAKQMVVGLAERSFLTDLNIMLRNIYMPVLQRGFVEGADGI